MVRGLIYPAEDCPPKLGLDEACLKVTNEANFDVKLYEQLHECYIAQCEGLLWKVLPAKSNASLLVNSAYPLHFYYTKLDGWTSVCTETLSFSEHKTYSWNISETTCGPYMSSSTLDVNYWLPVVLASTILIVAFALWVVAKRVYKSHWISSFRYEKGLYTQPECNIQEPNTSACRQEPRIKSLDTFRGICIAIMIFVNYGGGQYRIFQHTAWNGLTIADVVFPWFLWVMGVSLVLSLRSQFNGARCRMTVWRLVILRSLILIVLGLIINLAENGLTAHHLYRIPGVLQRVGLTYFIIASMETIFTKPGSLFKFRVFEDIVYGWIQNVIASVLVLTWLIVTFKLHVPDCKRGYMGPGGLEKGKEYENCTGGAAGYIDRVLFTPNHIYQYPTCEKVYRTTQPYDPEGLLGTLTAAFLVNLGAQAGRILTCNNSSTSLKITKMLLWGAVSVICAGILCKFSLGNEGYIPINKNLFSLSYVLLTGGAAFILLAFLYVIIDNYDFWDGSPFKYAGMNAILLYVGHVLVRDIFPWSWKPIWNTHAELLAMNLWGTCLWLSMAYILWRKHVFLSV